MTISFQTNSGNSHYAIVSIKDKNFNTFFKFLLPPRGSFVIVKFSISLNLSRNMDISVRSLYHMILENVCMEVRIPLYLRI